MLAAAPHRGPTHQTLIHGSTVLGISRGEDDEDACLGTDRGFAICFAGSFDNMADLGIELGLDDGSRTGTVADVLGVLAEGYRRFREELPNRMRGVYAVAISDGQRVLCFRDHVGYRPLFYRFDTDALYAASEAKQVIAGAGIPRQPDLDVVEAIYFRTYDDATPAALRGVRRLPKATSLSLAGGQPRLQRYWHPERLLETATFSRAELKERFTSLMEQAVGRSLSRPAAISLSGGIDSPAVAAFAAPIHRHRFGRPLQALSVVYPRHPSVDESSYVKIVTAALDIPLHAYEQTANAVADLRRWTALADTPYPAAALAQYEEDYLRARALDARVLLTGEHAEFVMGMQWHVLDHLLTHRRWTPAARQLRERRGRGASWIGLTRLVLRSLASDRVMAARNRFAARPASVPAWIDRSRLVPDDPVSARERWRDSQLTGFVGPGISLEAEEVCQQVCGVRSRKPWTDIDLWEFFLSLPAEMKFPDLRAKGLVRDLLRGRVPDEILDRRDKTVFDAAAMADVDYAALRGLLIDSPHRISGVDYRRLAAALDAERLTPIEYRWARNLANVHAFLSQW